VSDENKTYTYSYGGLARAGGGSRYAWKNIINSETYSGYFNIIVKERYFTAISTTLNSQELQEIYTKYLINDVKKKNSLGGRRSVEARKKIREQKQKTDM
jgi:hypothetical protein